METGLIVSIWIFGLSVGAILFYILLEIWEYKTDFTNKMMKTAILFCFISVFGMISFRSYLNTQEEEKYWKDREQKKDSLNVFIEKIKYDTTTRNISK